MIQKKYFMISVLLFLLPAAVFAHGTAFEVLQGGIGIQATYADKSPMADSDVKVLRPGSDEETPYCSGITDARGRFFFAPDKKGKWIIKVSDGMGHAVKSSITVDKDIAITATSASGMNGWQKLFAVASLAWGLIGTALYFKRKEK